jgi:hypothetical protein
MAYQYFSLLQTAYDSGVGLMETRQYPIQMLGQQRTTNGKVLLGAGQIVKDRIVVAFFGKPQGASHLTTDRQ